MAKKKQRQASKPWSMRPSKHSDVSQLLEEDDLVFTFYSNDDDEGCIKMYDTWIMGYFGCHNPSCSTKGWTSGHVAITIRLYPQNKYNARIYHQHCKRCGSVSKPTLDHTYADRVSYRIRKWCGIQLEAPPYADRTTPPHRCELCEGCKAGHCQKGREINERGQASPSAPFSRMNR
ncbi:zinc-binding domain-containing protein [Xylariaceae sp. AK1471]|nr:zinc-binding domain-containing protein [Xylariaceae sp. AK1471]